MHPTVIIQAFRQALEDAVAILGDEVGVPVDMDDEAQLVKVVQSSIGTKFISRWANLAAKIALDAIKMEDEAAFFIVQFLIMYAVKWLFWIALSIATWDREGMSLISVKYLVI